MKRSLLMLAAIIAVSGCGGGNKKEIKISAPPGVDTTQAAPLFKTLMGHCPGIYKYRDDIETVTYKPHQHADFTITLKQKLSDMPSGSYASGHSCHFSVSDKSATVSKRPCVWLCSGGDMSGVDGNERSFEKGNLIGPKVLPWANLSQAISATRLDMADIKGGDVSQGAAKLAIWGADNMRWGELLKTPTGKYGMVMKDPDTQRGKRLCMHGQIIEIAADSSVPGKKLFSGGFFGNDGHIYRFIAVGSTGNIVARSRAGFCGIVTGQQHYQNSIGGVAHAVHLVGMFDLKENKNR